MGGVGKTQLAAAHARTAWSTGELDVLVSVTASTRSAIVAGCAQAGAELLAADASDAGTAAGKFLAWREPKPRRRRCRWLVVLDAIDDPSDVKGLWPPASPSGFTPATTRRRDTALTGNGRQLVRVGLLTPEQTLAYLTRASAANGRTESEDQLAALADDLSALAAKDRPLPRPAVGQSHFPARGSELAYAWLVLPGPPPGAVSRHPADAGSAVGRRGRRRHGRAGRSGLG